MCTDSSDGESGGPVSRRSRVRLLLGAIALSSCAHSAPTTPAENTALAVDSAGLIVDVISFTADHFLAKSEPQVTTLAFALPDGGILVVRAIEVVTVAPAQVVPVALPGPATTPPAPEPETPQRMLALDAGR